ncbi:MAG TPA: TolC family protein [Anaeromyxobacteraceae bacterium]|nr:TolC family protein [Anaeromyxobacteraceae bacterium]
MTRTRNRARAVVRICLAVVLAAGASAEGFGEPAPAVLRVEDAVSAALRNNLSVKAAAVDERARKLASDLSFNRFFPSFSVQGTALRLNQTLPSVVGVMGGAAVYMAPDQNNLAFGATIQEVFSPTFFVLMNQAALAYRDSSVDKVQAEQSIAAAAKKAFYQLIVQKKAIDLTRSRLQKAVERRRQAEVSFQIGQTSELNFAYASQNVEGIVIDLRGMEAASQAALTHFEQLLGFDTRPDMELLGDLDVTGIALDRWDGRESDRLDVKKATLAVQQVENALRIQNTALMPSLIFQYKLDPTLNGPTAGNLFQGSNWVQPTGGLSLTLSWDLSPLLPGSDYRVKLDEYNARLGLARDSQALALRSARDDAEEQKSSIRVSMDNLESLGRALESAKRAYDLTEASYKAGAGRLLDLQDAELAWQGANLQILNEKLKLMALVFDRDAKYAARRE